MIVSSRPGPLKCCMTQGGSDTLNSIHSESITNDLLDALSAKLSPVSGHLDVLDKLRSVGHASKLRNANKPTLEDVTDRCAATHLRQVDAACVRVRARDVWLTSSR